MIETSKENQQLTAQIITARLFPRKMSEVRAAILRKCQSKEFAVAAIYRYAEREVVHGPSIRLAEAMANEYTNLDFGTVDISVSEKWQRMQAYCYDLESNVRNQRTFMVPLVNLTSGRRLVDPNDRRSHAHSFASRQLRACILALLPTDLVDAALDKCKETIIKSAKANIGGSFEDLEKHFEEIGVGQDKIHEWCAGRVITTDMLFDLLTIHNAIKDGLAKREDFFKYAPAEKTDEEIEAAEKLSSFLQSETTEINFVTPTEPKK